MRSHRRNQRWAIGLMLGLALASLASEPDPGLQLGDFGEGRTTVQPGLPMAHEPDGPIDLRVQGCTTAFLAADDAYVEGRSGVRRYMVSVAHCVNGTSELDGSSRTFDVDDAPILYLSGMSPTTWVPGGRVDNGQFERFALGLWYDSSEVLPDAGFGPTHLDAGIALLDDDISVDPGVPELGTPTEVATSFASAFEDPMTADRISMYGRATGLGDLAGRPTAAHRDGLVQAELADWFLCTTIPAGMFDSGSPGMVGDAAAGIASSAGLFNAEHYAAAREEQLCQSTAGLMRVDAILELFEESTGIRLHLLTERAGPILR